MQRIYEAASPLPALALLFPVLGAMILAGVGFWFVRKALARAATRPPWNLSESHASRFVSVFVLLWFVVVGSMLFRVASWASTALTVLHARDSGAFDVASGRLTEYVAGINHGSGPHRVRMGSLVFDFPVTPVDQNGYAPPVGGIRPGDTLRVSYVNVRNVPEVLSIDVVAENN